MHLLYTRLVLLTLCVLVAANPLRAAVLLVQPQGPGILHTHTPCAHSSPKLVSRRLPDAGPATRPGLLWGLGALLLAVGTVALFFSVGFLVASLALLGAVVLGAIGIGKGRRGRIWAMIGLGIAVLYQVVLAAYVLLLTLAFAYG